jgi:catechol 2,3-dioxygenase-like lactoylglutathione lyase family enzyme
MPGLFPSEWVPGKICQIAEVVPDLEAAVERYWKTMGFGPWYFWDFEPPDLHDITYRGQKVEKAAFRLALAMIGPVQYELMQPLYGPGIHRDFLEKRPGGGVHHIKIYCPDMQKALDDFAQQGIQPLQQGKYDEDWHVYLDTEAKYGVIWELGNQGRIRPPMKRYPAK